MNIGILSGEPDPDLARRLVVRPCFFRANPSLRREMEDRRRLP